MMNSTDNQNINLDIRSSNSMTTTLPGFNVFSDFMTKVTEDEAYSSWLTCYQPKAVFDDEATYYYNDDDETITLLGDEDRTVMTVISDIVEMRSKEGEDNVEKCFSNVSSSRPPLPPSRGRSETRKS